MTCTEYLMRYREAMEDVDELNTQIEAMELRKERMTSKYGEKTRVKNSGGKGRDLDAALGDLILERDQLLEEANQVRDQLMNFISQVGEKNDIGRRYRRLLRLYYAEGFSWDDVRHMLRPVHIRKDGRQITGKRGCLSETSLFRVRLEALGQAEVEFRRLGLG